jgi:hypothetical protein
MVRIHNQFAPANFMVLDMVDEEYDTTIILGRSSSTLLTRSSTLDLDKSTSNFLEKRYAVISTVIQLTNNQRRAALEGDVNHPDVKGTNLYGISGKKMRNL